MMATRETQMRSSLDFQRLYTARFIPLFLHLMMLIFVFVFANDLVGYCTSNDYSSGSGSSTWTYAWTGVSLGLVVIEMVLSLSGLTVFREYPVFFSIVLHSAACVLLSAYFMSNISICTGSPYLLFFCTLFPLIVELIGWLELFRFRKKL